MIKKSAENETYFLTFQPWLSEKIFKEVKAQKAAEKENNSITIMEVIMEVRSLSNILKMRPISMIVWKSEHKTGRTKRFVVFDKSLIWKSLVKSCFIGMALQIFMVLDNFRIDFI